MSPFFSACTGLLCQLWPVMPHALTSRTHANWVHSRQHFCINSRDAPENCRIISENRFEFCMHLQTTALGATFFRGFCPLYSPPLPMLLHAHALCKQCSLFDLLVLRSIMLSLRAVLGVCHWHSLVVWINENLVLIMVP